MDYKKAYILLVGTMSNAIDEIHKSRVITQEMENAIRMLKKGLEKAEEMYIGSEEPSADDGEVSADRYICV